MSLPFKKLSDDKVILHKRRETFKKQMKQMTTQYEALKAQLNDNETYTQVDITSIWRGHATIVGTDQYPHRIICS